MGASPAADDEARMVVIEGPLSPAPPARQLGRGRSRPQISWSRQGTLSPVGRSIPTFDHTTAIGLAEEASVSPASPILRLVAALILAAPVVACDVFEGRQNVAEYADDSTITNTVRARFVDDPVVHVFEVGVTTLHGNVRLLGHVNSERERQRAEEIAYGVKGVRGVSNEIGVR
jgi:hypothetical protein